MQIFIIIFIVPKNIHTKNAKKRKQERNKTKRRKV